MLCDNCTVNKARHTCPNCDGNICDQCWTTDGLCEDCLEALDEMERTEEDVDDSEEHTADYFDRDFDVES